MALQLRYTGSKYSIDGAVWRCDILQEAAAAYPEVGDLDVEEISIEWPEEGKEAAVCGSVVTLKVNSPGDRTYLDLYSIKPCQIRLEIYRNDALYWSGCLDPEFYEEPYDRGFNYDVSLTFSDLGVLGRIPYDLSGRKTLRQILETALGRSQIRYASIDETYISTSFTNGTVLTLSGLSLPSENFYDEDGKPMDYKAVLEGILQPLGLRLIQKAGVIWVYDLNALVTSQSVPVRRIVWDGTDYTIGTDVVYNNITVTFSPYSDASLAGADFEYGDTHGPEWTNLTASIDGVRYNGGSVPAGLDAPECYSYYPDYDPAHRHGSDWDYNLVDFTVFLSSDGSKCPGLDSIGALNKYFHMEPNLGGSTHDGVAVGFYTGGHGSLESGYPTLKGISPASHPESLAMRTERLYLPALSAGEQEDNYIRILMSLLVDGRYNPLESEGEFNEGSNCDKMKQYASFAFIPIAINLYDESGTALYHYTNRHIAEYARPGDSIRANRGTWEAGEAAYGDAWLAWYDPDDIKKGCGILGWKNNRQNFGVPISLPASPNTLVYIDTDTGTFKSWWSFDSFLKAPEGQFIPYPPTGGYLEVKVFNGVRIHQVGEGFAEIVSSKFSTEGLYAKLRWLLYGVPKISVVKRTLTLDDAQLEDIEYSGVINADAQEDLQLSTICGTAPSVCPTAKGIYLKSDTGEQVLQMSRAGRTDQVEHLLIGTLCSQYGDRRALLRGDIRPDTGGLALYMDACQEEGVRFLMAGEVQDVLNDTSSATLIEVRPDEYEGESHE